jgi:flagellar motor switch/type III secretory pathway protein FliN
VNVAPFHLGACPRVTTAAADASRAALGMLSRLPSHWRIDLPPIGAVQVTVAGPDLAVSQTDQIVLALARGADRGRLAVPPAFAARLIDLALGAKATFSSARALGPAERGLLVALLAPLLDVVGWSPSLGQVPIGIGLAPLALRLDGAFGGGPLWLDLPPGASGPHDRRRYWQARVADLPVSARVALATTELRLSDLLGLACGDALVFAGVAASAYLANGGDEPWDGRLVVGAYEAALRIDSRGALELAGEFQLTGTPSARPVAITREGAMDVSGPTEKASAVLGAAPIEVVAELARITLRGDEVLGLAPGVVLTVAASRRRAIVLRVGDEIWAEGELVDVDGELGVRVTRMLRPEG